MGYFYIPQFLIILAVIFYQQTLEIFFTMLNSPPLNQDEIGDQLNRLQGIIFDKIDNIRDVIQDQDRWVAEEIAMKKQPSTELIYPKYDKKVCYYQQFWKVYLINEIMISKIKEYSVSNKLVTKEIDELQETQKQWSQIYNQKIKKKVRRPSALIVKSYECPFPNCDKNYGTDVSLNLHMKLKHNSGTKTQRQTLARQIILAEERGEKVQINLTFPPGYMDKFRESMKKQNIC